MPDDFRKLTDQAINAIKAAQLGDENDVVADALRYARQARSLLNAAMHEIARRK